MLLSYPCAPIAKYGSESELLWCRVILIFRATGHIEDEIETPAMQLPDLSEVNEESLKNPDFIKTLEDILMSWETHITKVIDDCLKKVPNAMKH